MTLLTVTRLCWYVADKYLRDLKASAGASLPPRVVTSIIALADFLVSEVRTLEHGSEQAKKEVKDQIPADRVKDAAATARELRWRSNLAGGYTSDGEDSHGLNGHQQGHRSLKRKQTSSESPSKDEPVRFKNFRPRKWECIVDEMGESEWRTVKLLRPQEDLKAWRDDEVGDAEADVTARRNTIVKIRRTEKGLQRERVDRVVEEWVWT